MKPLFGTRRLLLPALALLLLGMGAYYFLAGSPAPTPDTTPAEAAVPVTTAAAATQDITTSLTYSGTITPARTITLAPKVTGQILDLPAPEGSTVEAGELLAQLDGEQYALALARLEAKLEQARLNLTHQERELDRYTKLYAAEALSEQQYEQAALARDLAAASLREAEAALAEAQANLQNTEIRAPEAGQILTLHKEEGDLAVTGQPLVTLAGGSELVVQIPVVEGDLSALSVGMEARLHLPEAAEPAAATVSRIDPSLDPLTRTAQVEIPLPGEEGENLKPGMSAQADLILSQTPGTLTVPRSSLLQQDDGTWAVYVIQDNRARLQPLTLGPTTDRLAAVAEGLTAGDQVAVSNISQLYDGAPVLIFGEEEDQDEHR